MGIMMEHPSGLQTRYKGTGKVYFTPMGNAGAVRLGMLDQLNLGFSVEQEKLYDTETAAKAVIAEVESSREASVTLGMREWKEENLLIAFQGAEWVDNNQLSGTRDLASLARVANLYVPLGHIDVQSLKLTHGAADGGPFQVGETITGSNSSATGTVAWAGSDYVELVDVSGAFVSGETLSGSTSSATAISASVMRQDDVVVVDAASPTVRYVQGTDYTLDPQSGFLRVLSAGAINADPFVAYDHPAITRRVAHMLSGKAVEGHLHFRSDKGDTGVRVEFDAWKVRLVLNGDVALLGGDESVLQLSGSLIADTTRPQGQQYARMAKLQEGS